MTFRHIAIGALVGLAGIFATAATRAQEPPRPDQLVDALNSVFGKHPGDRAAHTKGICLTGLFTPSADASSLSKAPQFAKPVPIIARFSLGGGNPQAPDNAQDNVRGLAIKFDLGNGASSDLVMISAPMFFARTPALFVELLQTLGSGDKDKLNAFFAAHPEMTRQNVWLTSHPVPASYAGMDYFGVHAFTFTNAEGKATVIKYKAIPEAGELGLTQDEAKAKGPDFYAPELKERLAKGPVVFDLVAIPGQKGATTNDPTLAPRRRSARSRSLRSRPTPPATPSASFQAIWQTALPVRRTTPSSLRVRRPTSSRWSGVRLLKRQAPPAAQFMSAVPARNVR